MRSSSEAEAHRIQWVQQRVASGRGPMSGCRGTMTRTEGRREDAGVLEDAMRMRMTVVTGALIDSDPTLRARAGPRRTGREGCVSGLGGFSTSVGDTTGNLLVEGGVRIAPHVMVFGNLGQLRNLQAAGLQPTIDDHNSRVIVRPGPQRDRRRKPTRHVLSRAGSRVEVPTGSRISAVRHCGGVGVARLNPTTQFTFSSGTLPDGSTPRRRHAM